MNPQLAALGLAGGEILDAELPPLFANIEESFQIIATVEGARSMAAELHDHRAALNHWLQDFGTRGR